MTFGRDPSSSKGGFFSAIVGFFTKRQSSKATVPQKAREVLNAWRHSANPELLRRALKIGFPVQAKLDPNLGTALHIAAHQGCLQALALLHANHSRDTVKNDKGRLAIHLAAAKGSDDCVLYLLKTMGSKMDVKDSEMQTPLMLAVQSNSVSTVKLLASRGACVVGMKDKDGMQAIHFCKSEEMLVYLLSNTSTSIDATDAHGRTLLHIAAAANNAELIRALNMFSAAMDKPDASGGNALHAAALHRHPEAIRMLIRSGCSHTAVDHAGYTPLERALLQQDLAATNAFYEGGALFTKRQLLFLGILRREAELISALQREGQADAFVRSRSRLLAGSLSHPNLQFPPSDKDAAPLFSIDDLQKELLLLKDPVRRPLGTTTSETLIAVFTRMLRHSMAEQRPERLAAKPHRFSESVLRNKQKAGTKDAAPSENPAGATLPGAVQPTSPSGPPRNSLERLLPHYRSGLTDAEAPDDDASLSRSIGLFGPLVQSAVVRGVTPDDPSSRRGAAAAQSIPAPQWPATVHVLGCASASAPTNVQQSLFWMPAKVAPDPVSATPGKEPAEQGPRRESIVQQWKRSKVQRRRNPWGAVQETTDDERFPPRQLKSMPQRRMAMEVADAGIATADGTLDLSELHRGKLDGMADFEDMMARRAALFRS